MATRLEEQQKILNSLESPVHGLLLLAPRVGKTRLALEIIKKEKPKNILWITPNTKLRDIDIPKEFIIWKAKRFLSKTKIICYASLAKEKGSYELIILDEFQDLTLANALPLIRKDLKFERIIGLSGTYPKHNIKSVLYRALNLKIIHKMDIDEAVDKKLISDYKIILLECMLDAKTKNLKAGSKDKPFYTTEQAQYKFMTDKITAAFEAGLTPAKYLYLNRMRFIYNLPSKNAEAKKLLNELPGRTLIFTGGIELANQICEYTYHSKTDTKDLQKFLSGEINKLACVNAGGVGFTYKNVQNFIIVQMNSNKKGDVTQKIARSLLLQKNYEAKIFILYVANTVDEEWKNKALEEFDPTKIVKYVKGKERWEKQHY